MMKVLGVLALLFVLIGLAFVVGGLMPSEIEYQAPSGSLNLPFDDVEAAPRVAETTCNCETCLESKALAEHANSVGLITTPEEQINSGRRAASVNHTLNHRSTDLERANLCNHLMRCWCMRGRSLQSGRFSGATA